MKLSIPHYSFIYIFLFLFFYGEKTESIGRTVRGRTGSGAHAVLFLGHRLKVLMDVTGLKWTSNIYVSSCLPPSPPLPPAPCHCWISSRSAFTWSLDLEAEPRGVLWNRTRLTHSRTSSVSASQPNVTDSTRSLLSARSKFSRQRSAKHIKGKDAQDIDRLLIIYRKKNLIII